MFIELKDRSELLMNSYCYRYRISIDTSIRTGELKSIITNGSKNDKHTQLTDIIIFDF